MEELQLERGLGDQDKFMRILQEVDVANEELKNIQSYYDATIQDMKTRLGNKSNLVFTNNNH